MASMFFFSDLPAIISIGLRLLDAAIFTFFFSVIRQVTGHRPVSVLWGLIWRWVCTVAWAQTSFTHAVNVVSCIILHA